MVKWAYLERVNLHFLFMPAKYELLITPKSDFNNFKETKIWRAGFWHKCHWWDFLCTPHARILVAGRLMSAEGKKVRTTQIGE